MAYGHDHFNIIRERMYPTPYQNSTLLPLLLLSLAKQKHTPDTTTQIDYEYDYVIVGAGSAGSVVASRLSEIPCVNVLLLEAGDPPPLVTEIPGLSRVFVKTDLDWDYLTVPQKYTGFGHINRQIPLPSGKAIGGSSIIGGMLATRGNRENYNKWERLGAKGWSWKEVFPYFLRLENNTDHDIAYNGFHAIGGPITLSRPPYTTPIQKAVLEGAHYLGYPFVDVNGPYQVGFNDFQATMRKGQKCSAAKAYLVPSEHRKNLDIVSGAFVTKVLISDNRAVGVQFDHKGMSCQVRARKEVILSAGTINTAQLLMLSGIGPRKTLERFDIPVVADLPVGRNLQDRCGSAVNLVVNGPIPPVIEKLTDPRNIKLYTEKKVGPLTSAQFVNNLAYLQNHGVVHPKHLPSYEFYLLEGAAFLTELQLNMKPSVYEAIYGPYENDTIMWCDVSVLHPKSRGYVTLRSTNPYDSPLIDPKYFEHPDDLYDVVSGMKTCLRIAATRPVQNLGIRPFETVAPGCEKFLDNLDLYLECFARTFVYTLGNKAGTAKMGDPSDPSTVVNPELRVKGIKGLRVVDASVMPVIPSGHLNLPVTMVAEKASDIIKGSIYCH